MSDIKKLTEQQAKLQKQLNNKRNQINALKKKIEKDRVHKMCEVAGFLFTEIAGWKGEHYNDYQNLDLESFKECCLKNKDTLARALKGERKPNTTQNPGSNLPNNAVLEQKRINTQSTPIQDYSQNRY